MNILMIEVPTAEREKTVPFGLLYAASSAHRRGHNVRIIDVATDGLEYPDIKKIIAEFSPRVIGMGGITSGYRNCKELIRAIKSDYRTIPVVVGGVISSAADMLLKNAGADYIVHGEGEVSFVNLIDTIGNKSDVSGVKGISFLRKGDVHRTEPQPQIKDLDEIPMPEFGLLDIGKYLMPVDEWIKAYFGHDDGEYEDARKVLDGKKYLFPVVTSRGCTHRCIFCYRHQHGLRQHSARRVIEMMRHLRDKYDVGLFQISDELTTGDKRWVRQFCEGLKNEKMGVNYIILSSRVDNVDEEMLAMLKESGCVMINYGYESGSDLILKEIRKGVVREEALKAGLLTKKIGIKNVPEIIIGFPSETEETVADTLDFLKRLDTWPVSINTPIPFPETPLWQHAVKHGLIKNKEEFILGYKRRLFMNFTQYPDRRIRNFASRVHFDTKLHYLSKRKKRVPYLKCLAEKFAAVTLRGLLPENIFETMKSLCKR